MLSLLLRSIFAVKWEPYSHRIFAHPKGYVRKRRGIDMEKKIHLYVSKKHPALFRDVLNGELVGVCNRKV